VVAKYGTRNRRPRLLGGENTLDLVTLEHLGMLVFSLSEEHRRTLPVVGSMMSMSMPKKGKVAAPGLVLIAPGKGVTTMEPVSVIQ
jgi:hypothetical protein